MTRRLIIMRAAVVFVCLVILGRLGQLQLIEGRRNRELADHNRIRVVRALAPRGSIYDRNGRLLATSRLSFSVTVVPESLHAESGEDAVGALARVLGLRAEEVAAYLDKQRAAGYESVPLYRDAPRAVVARVEELSPYLSGVSVIADAVRYYPHGRLAAHALGYVREISPDELARPENADRQPMDLIGKAGVERIAEEALRGTNGGRQIEVDARGRRVRTLGMVAPQPGHDVRLTLDLDLQRTAEQALAGRPGAVVALDPRNGEILALASSPSYDPNLFVGSLSPSQWRGISGPDHPQQNRATTSRYPPGSLFKIVTAAAALEAGEVRTSDWFQCTGAFHIGSWRMRCSKRSGHGDVSFLQGFAQSCNVMFASLGRRVGPDRLAEMARRLGLGEASGVDLPDESAGLVPSPEWKRERRKEAWYPGDTCQMAVGQGDCLATPLQMAQLAAAIANGGKLMRPHIILSVAGEPSAREPVVAGAAALKASTVDAIREGMKGVVSPGGTAAGIATDRYQIAGKTGTAQASRGAPHAWFAGFAPADNPRIAVAVIVEHGGNGSKVAAPIARRMFDTALLKRQPKPDRQLRSAGRTQTAPEG
jgi:penicillin-binding protein 2